MSKHTKHRAKPARSNLVLVVITRDEVACTERCLINAKPRVDRIIVLDTGSTDDTVAIAETYGAQTYHFAWVDDFPAARNAAPAAANADQSLVLDADERIEASTEELRNVYTSGLLLGAVYTRSEYNISGHVEHSDSQTAHLLSHGVRYKGHIHEQPVAVAANLQHVRLPLVIGHGGYTNAKLDRKRRRNHTLLQLELVTHPDDLYVLYQLSRDLEINQKDPTGTAVYYQRAFAKAFKVAPHRYDLCVCLLACLSKSRQLDSAITLVGGWTEEWSDSSGYSYMLGHLMFEAAA